MREDQIVGLNEAARKMVTQMVEATECGVRIVQGIETPFERKIQVNLVKREPFDSYTGMFDTPHTLYKYTLPDGTVYTEYVQAEPWSSGPCFFLALKDSSGTPVKKTLWSNKEIQKQL